MWMHCVIWWHKIKFPTLYTKHMALKVYCGLWCCISCFSDIQRKKWQRLHFREEETERLNLWHGRGTESWAISLQGEPLSLFGGWIRDSGRQRRHKCEGKSQKRYGGKRERGNWSGRVWGCEARGVTEAAAEAEIRSYFITIWTMEDGGGVERPSERPWWSVSPKAWKRLSTLGCAVLAQRGSARQTNRWFFSYLCVTPKFAEDPLVPSDQGVSSVMCVYVHFYTI